MSSRYYLDYLRNMPDSAKKLYKIMAVNGSSQMMQAVAREYARLAAKGYRPKKGEKQGDAGE